MADKARPSKPEGGAQAMPPGARGPVKDGGRRPRAAGPRGKVKPEATSAKAVVPPKGRGKAKAAGQELQPRLVTGRKAKPTESDAAANTGGTVPAGVELPDQVTRGRRRSTGRAARGYVKFRVRMASGSLSIVDSQLVDSELAMPAALHAEYAYEVTDGDRILHADALPDFGVVRGFPNPSGRGVQQGHHVYEPETYEFDARAPAPELTRAGPSKVSIVLYRVKERPPERSMTRSATLGAQFDRELREVTRVRRIPASALPPELRPASKRSRGR